MAKILDVFMWIIIASVCVAVILHAKDVAGLVSSTGTDVVSLAKVLTTQK